MTTKRVAVIGSRETPQPALRLTTLFTNMLVELGYAIYSGGCPKGMDYAGLKGAYSHKTSDKSKNRIYLAWDGMSDLHHDPANGFYDATQFENYRIATIMAELARGSFHGLYDKGIKLHCRNPYQVLGDDLCSNVDFVLTWAIPTGKQGRVKGGTGTAVRIAVEHGIPVYNLYYEDVFNRVDHFVQSVLMQKAVNNAKQQTGGSG